jgi:hypothetical protein
VQNGAAVDPEVELQRQLAKKLGLKRGKTKMGGDDGLDDFLEGEGGVHLLFLFIVSNQLCWLGGKATVLELG